MDKFNLLNAVLFILSFALGLFALALDLREFFDFVFFAVIAFVVYIGLRHGYYDFKNFVKALKILFSK